MDIDEILKIVIDKCWWISKNSPPTTLALCLEVIITGRSLPLYPLTKEQFIFIWYYFVENWNHQTIRLVVNENESFWTYNQIIPQLKRQIITDEQKIYFALKYNDNYFS